MKKIVDLHNHLSTLQNFLLLRSKAQDHKITWKDHQRGDYQTLISLSLYPHPWENFKDIITKIENLKAQLQNLGSDVKLVTTKNDLNSDFKLGVLLHVESARIIREPKWQLPKLYENGVRGIIPLHFVDNHLGQSCDDPWRRLGFKSIDQGLTDRGVKFVEQMNDLGMWVDVSHTTDQTAEDILKIANEVMASHIAIRDLVPRMRNKTLEFYKKLAKKKGIFGLQPWQHLIGSEASGYESHMKLAIEEGLGAAVCLGTDLGAPIKTHPTIKSVYDCAEIAEQFDNYSAGIQYQNAYTFYQRVLD